MTKFQALYIKYLRIRIKGSFSYIGSHWERRYKEHIPFDNKALVPGNGRLGSELCVKAMVLLREKVEDGWN